MKIRKPNNLCFIMAKTKEESMKKEKVFLQFSRAVLLLLLAFGCSTHGSNGGI